MWVIGCLLDWLFNKMGMTEQSWIQIWAKIRAESEIYGSALLLIACKFEEDDANCTFIIVYYTSDMDCALNEYN